MSAEAMCAGGLKCLEAFRACGGNRHFIFGEPQAIADFNASERKRIAATPYGQHLARVRAFDADDSLGHLPDAEYDALYNANSRVSYAQYLRECV